MVLTTEIETAARELGEALKANPTVQAYLDACTAVDRDPALALMASELEKLYDELTARQRQGEVLSPYEINRFYKLREQVVFHPLMQRREAAQKELQAAFAEVSATMSSLLTMDYSALAG